MVQASSFNDSIRTTKAVGVDANECEQLARSSCAEIDAATF